MAYTQGRLASACSAVAHSSSNTDMDFPQLFSPVCAHRSPFSGEPASLHSSLCFQRRLLMYISQPVVLVRGIGCSFSWPGVSAHLGTKALESATARFQSCLSDYYIYNITLNGLLPLSHTQSPQLKKCV